MIDSFVLRTKQMGEVGKVHRERAIDKQHKQIGLAARFIYVNMATTKMK